MGGIVCVTPFDAAGERDVIKRYARMNAAQLVAIAGSTEIERYVNPQGGLKTVLMDNMVPTDVISQSAADILWLYGKSTGLNLPGWQGYMEKATAKHDTQEPYLPSTSTSIMKRARLT
uniref:Light-independent protochlorophyllide reductase subunit N n=1 Tax=Lygus hesperus TaxID=30085 RepID=A0A0A9ZHC1_LYGHE